jgi:hypothetical protein
MKPVRSLALALALGGLGATCVFAQSGASPGYPSTGRYRAPALLPLPQATGPWVTSTQNVAGQPAHAGYPVGQVAAAATVQAHGAVAPAANYVAQSTPRPVIAAPQQYRAPQEPVPSVSNPYYPELSYTGTQETITPAPPTPAIEAVPAAPSLNGAVVPGPEIAPNAYEQAASLGCESGDCGVCMSSCGPNWYGYVGGLIMTRDRANKFWTTFETGNNANQLMYFDNVDWGGGFETTVGFAWSGCDAGGCGDMGCNSCGSCNSGSYRHGIEFTYWGLYDLEGEDSRRSETNSLSTPIDLGFVDIPTPGLPASVFFDNAREHRVRRENEFHNVEINLLDFSTPAVCHGLQYNWLIGARYFKFDEFLQFGSVSGGNEFGSAGGINEAYLDTDVENNLIGAQIGGRADWRLNPRWRVFAGTKLGVFANDINYDARLYRGDGALATFSSTGNTFDLHAHETDVSMLAQIDLGLSWDFTQHWSATVGYRAVGITGLALADDQIPAFLAAEQDWTDIDSNGSMILHGGFAGLEFRY